MQQDKPRSKSTLTVLPRGAATQVQNKMGPRRTAAWRWDSSLETRSICPRRSVAWAANSTDNDSTRREALMTSSLLQCIELATGPGVKAAVIWLHGLGADGNDFVPIVPELKLPADLPVRFLFPNAPTRPVTINNGAVMRAWYDITFDGLERKADESGIRASQRALEQLIEREIERGVTSERVVLAGFSQGGAIALQTGVRYSRRLGGIMALSTYLPLASSLSGEANPANADVPIFMAHGAQDGMILPSLAKASRDKFLAHGYQVEWHEYPMPHSVCAEEVRDLSAWLQRILSHSV
jgi:phospholipase/carboxylesterase